MPNELMDSLFGGLKRISGAGVDVGKAIAEIPLNVVTAIPDFVKDPEVFLSGGKHDAIGALLSSDFRKKRATDLKAAREWEKMTQTKDAVDWVHGLFSGQATDTAQGELRKNLVEQGMPNEMLQPIANAAKAERHAARRAGDAIGMPEALVNIQDIGSAQQGGQSYYADDLARAQNVQQAGLTRGNQSHQFGLSSQLEGLRHGNRLDEAYYDSTLRTGESRYDAELKDWGDGRTSQRERTNDRFSSELDDINDQSEQARTDIYDKRKGKRDLRSAIREVRAKGSQDRMTEYDKYLYDMAVEAENTTQAQIGADARVESARIGKRGRLGAARLGIEREAEKGGQARLTAGTRGEQDRLTVGAKGDMMQEVNADKIALQLDSSLAQIEAKGGNAVALAELKATLNDQFQRAKAGDMAALADLKASNLMLIEQTRGEGRLALEDRKAGNRTDAGQQNAGNAVAYLQDLVGNNGLKGLKMPQRARIRAALRQGGEIAVKTANEIAQTIGGSGGTNVTVVNPGTVVNDLRKEMAAGEAALSGLDEIKLLAQDDPGAFTATASGKAVLDRLAEKVGVNWSNANERRQVAITLAEQSFNDYMLLVGGTTVAEPLRKALRNTWINSDDTAPQILAKESVVRRTIQKANALRERQITGLLDPKTYKARVRENAGQMHKELSEIDGEQSRDVSSRIQTPLSAAERAAARAAGIPESELPQ